ncbi:MAG: hypothetical protein EHM78_02350 [Myxococcaceae bacterium]|nr:MAG: hypothetical protein EHM78_02350 [Myxococcaceae bacterium]
MTFVPAPFTEAAEALRFMLAGKATVTLRSKETDQRFTFRIKSPEDGNVHFVQLMNGPDNETAYVYVGYIRRGVFFHGGSKARVSREAPSCKAFAWAWQNLQKDYISQKLEIWHEGRCGRCSRKLTVPHSIKTGFGPECASRFFAEEIAA